MKTDFGDDDATNVDMAPMIDCVFLLLIFFLVAATIRKKHNELPIELPPAGSAQVKKASDETLVVSIFKEGGEVSYAVSTVGEKTKTGGGQNERVKFNKLIETLKTKATENINRDVRIDCDSKIPYGKLAQVIDHLELYQLHRIGLRTSDTGN